MCGRFYLDASPEVVTEYFDLASVPDLIPRYNIAPSQEIATILMGDRQRELGMLRWGLIPFWAKDTKIGYSTINARAETVDRKPAFRAAFKHHRCLIPASGFYEWRPEGGIKQPYCIRPRRSPLFAFAGLYEHWDRGRKPVDSCSIIVTCANRTIEAIHNRMPVILSPENFKAWLDPVNQDPDTLKPLLCPAPEDDIRLYPVSRRVSNSRYDEPGCILPISHTS